MTSAQRWLQALPFVASIWFVGGVALILVFSGDSLGYDYQAYVAAAQRLVDGRPLYDTAVDLAGGFAIFLYPPPYAVAFLPFTLLSATVGLWAWALLSVAAVAVAIAILPVAANVRWSLLLLAGLDWPVLYAIKLGQVGPVLLLVFAIGWRWLSSPVAVGGTSALGTLIKLQPGLLFGWALLTRQWRVVAAGIGVIAALILVTLPLTSVGAWSDYAVVIRRISDPIATPNNFTAGAIAVRAGVDGAMASAVQLVAFAAAGVLWVLVCRRGSLAAGYLATVVASQLLSPLLWDHYAIFLLLPVAMLLERGQWWAALIPLSTSLPLVFTVAAPVYPILLLVGFYATLVALLLEPTGQQDGAGRGTARVPGVTVAGAA